MNQSYSNLEILLINDGSTDGIEEKLEFYKKIDNRIKVINQENKGLSEARNTGLNICKGEFISFVDSDDWIEKNFILDLYETTKLFNTKIAHSGRKVHYGKKIETKYLSISKKYDSSLAINKILYGTLFDVAVWDKIFARELFSNIRFPKGKINEDASIIFDLIVLSKFISHSGKIGYNYRKREGSITSESFSKSKMDIIENLSNLKNKFTPLKINIFALNFYKTRLSLYVYSMIIKYQGYIRNENSILTRNFIKKLFIFSLLNPLNSIKTKIILLLMIIRLYK